MRQFYDEWQPISANRPMLSGELAENTNRPMSSGDLSVNTICPSETGASVSIIDLNLLSNYVARVEISEFSAYDFLRIGFYHHSEILAKEKSLNGRLFYIARCAAEFWTVEALKSNLRGDLYSKTGAISIISFGHCLYRNKPAERSVPLKTNTCLISSTLKMRTTLTSG